MWIEKHAELLSSLIDELNASNLKWLILRNYEGLPQKNNSKDVDISVAKNDFGRANELLQQVAKKCGFFLFQRMRYPRANCYIFFTKINESLSTIKIDLLQDFGFMWRGAILLRFKDLYNNKIQYSNFYVPSPACTAFILLVKTLIPAGFIKEKYRSEILQAIENYPKEFQSFITIAFGNEARKKLWPFLEAGKLDSAISFKSYLRRCANIVNVRDRPLTYLNESLRAFFWGIIRRIKRPKASFIAVIGPDGVGKTTFINAFRKELCQAFMKDADEILTLHFRPRLLPNLKKVFFKKGYDEAREEFNNPHRASPAGFFSSLIRLLYYVSDYLIGYWIYIRPNCIQQKICLFDRYCYDFIVDPLRSRLNLPLWLRTVLSGLIPQPDIIFFLDGDPLVIHGRKSELPRDEIARQLIAYRNLVSSSERFSKLDAHQAPLENAKWAVRLMIEKNSFDGSCSK